VVRRTEATSDNADDAEATLSLSIGESAICITRSLGDLRLISFKIDGREVGGDEDFYQNEIARLVDVWSFGDWILILRYLVFYFEDRKALVWDHTAQKQLIRVLFLSKGDAQKWYEAEREILEKDSEIRNAIAALFKEEKELAVDKTQVKDSGGLRQELESLSDLQQADSEKIERYLESIEGISEVASVLRTTERRI